MGRFCHVLKGNKTTQRPRNWCFVDTEADIETLKDGTEIQTLRLGVCMYRRDGHGRNLPRERWFRFTDAGLFWNWITAVSEQDRRLVVLAYNLKYDLRPLNAFWALHNMGFEQKRLYIKGRVCIVEWRQGKQIVIGIDACNYFEGNLEQWGEMLGIEKPPVDFHNVGQEELFHRCEQDVKILVELWDRWLSFLDVNDLGVFSYTRAGQSFSAFRHRFMPTPIYVHDNVRVLELEREAYYGGRTEAYWIGPVKGGPWWKLDINSMYPAVMVHGPVPVKLRGMTRRPSVATVEDILTRNGICADLEIETDEPIYPVRDGFKVVFPTGRFHTCLTTPEVKYAIQRGHVRSFECVSIYWMAVLFDRFIDHLYNLRMEYKRVGNTVFSKMVKYLMVSLYGKFGQLSEQWKKVENWNNDPDGEYEVINGETGQHLRYIVIASERWDVQGKQEAYHSFPAIAGHVTAYARLKLWSLIQAAGPENVFYVDTDSLIVNRAGRERLEWYINPEELGALKVEYETDRLEVYSPKDYTTGIEEHHKGLSPAAVRNSDGSYADRHWEGLKSAFNAGHLDRVIIHPVRKVLKREYTKGQVTDSGAVLPLTFSASSRPSA